MQPLVAHNLLLFIVLEVSYLIWIVMEVSVIRQRKRFRAGAQRQDKGNQTYFYTPLSFKIASDKAMLTSDPAITCVTVWRRSTTRDQLTSTSNKNAGNITAP